MNTQDFFWLLAGLMLGATVVLLPAKLLPRASGVRWRARIAVLGVCLLLVGVAVGLYLTWGRPELIVARPAARPATGPVSPLDVAAEKLAARLSQQGGTAEEWILLAQTYEHLGRGPEAEAARSQRALSPGSQTATPAAADATLAAAEALRRKRDFPAAVAAFEDVIARGGMTADGWADYADALASRAGGRLAGAPSRAIEQALRLDPAHPKALWLAASLAMEEHRYARALELWGSLRRLVPDDSADAPVIEGNIAEARGLAAAGAGGERAGATPVTASTPVVIDGVVEIDPVLLTGVGRGAVLFVFAKSADSPGPPLAVWRTTPARWPVAFRLDDSMAMLPSRKLSDFRTVVVEARLSRSGRAETQPGDLSGPGVRLETAARAPITLHLASRTT